MAIFAELQRCIHKDIICRYYSTPTDFQLSAQYSSFGYCGQSVKYDYYDLLMQIKAENGFIKNNKGCEK